MLNMSDKSKSFLKKWLPEVVGSEDPNSILDPLYELIMQKGFEGGKQDESFDHYNPFGVEAQEVYDDIYNRNQ